MWHRCPPYSDPSWPACCTLTMASIFSALQARLWDISELPCSPSSETLTGCLHLCMDCCPLSNFSSLIWSPIGPVLILSYRRLLKSPWRLAFSVTLATLYLFHHLSSLLQDHVAARNASCWLLCLKNSSWSYTQYALHSVQFSSVAQSCLTLCNPINCSTPGLPVHHQLPELTQTQVHWVSDAIQPSHPLLSPSPPDPNPSQHQSLFQWVNSSHEVAKVLEFQL